MANWKRYTKKRLNNGYSFIENKSKKEFLIVIGVMVLLSLILLVSPNKNITGNVIYEEESYEEDYLTDQFLEVNELHWGNMPIKFKIKGDGCSEYVEKRIRWGFETITEETDGVIKFEEIIDNTIYKEDIIKINEFKKNIKIIILGFNTNIQYYKVVFRGKEFSESFNPFEEFEDGDGLFNYSTIYEIDYSTNYEIENFEIMEFSGEYLFGDKIFIREIIDGETITIDLNNPDKDLVRGGEEENDPSTDILIQCHLEAPIGESNEFYHEYTQADALPQIEENLITYAHINFYNVNKLGGKYSGGCLAYPSTTIHEVLHTFGFDDLDDYDRNSIMSPLDNGCAVRDIDEDIIIKLKEIYG